MEQKRHQIDFRKVDEWILWGAELELVEGQIPDLARGQDSSLEDGCEAQEIGQIRGIVKRLENDCGPSVVFTEPQKSWL